MIKAIFFDMGGVTNNMIAHHVEKKVKELFQIPDFTLLGNNIHINDLFDEFERGIIDELSLWTTFAKRINKPLPSKWETILGDSIKKIRFNPHMKNLILNLKKKGYIVAALSNISPPFAKYHHKLGHYTHFHNIYLSFEIGIRKPHKDIYLHALNHSKVKPEESIFIDDNIHNIEAAKKIGIHSIHFKNSTQLKKELLKYIRL